MREKVQRMEDALLQMPQANIVTKHSFPDGKYERKITVPPWTVLTGAPHKTPYRVRLEQGTTEFLTEDGLKTLTAPAEFDAPAGLKRVGRVMGDGMVWVDIYDNPDNCTDISVLDARLYEVPEIGLGDTRKRAAIEKAKADYARFLEQAGMTQESMDSVVKTDDLIQMPEGHHVELRDSEIAGKGMFATACFGPGSVICPGRINGHRTPAGRYINHSPEPNIVPVKVGDDIFAVAIKPISTGDELLVDYRESLRVNIGLDVGEIA